MLKLILSSQFLRNFIHFELKLITSWKKWLINPFIDLYLPRNEFRFPFGSRESWWSSAGLVL